MTEDTRRGPMPPAEANALFEAKYNGLTIRQRDPIPVDSSDPRHVDKLNREIAHRGNIDGDPQQAIELRQLEARLEVAQARAAQFSGEPHPQLAQEIDSLTKSIAWQKSRASVAQPPTLDGTSGPAGFRLERTRGQLSDATVDRMARDAYRTDMERATRHEIEAAKKKGFTLSVAEAQTIINTRLESGDVAGVLPTWHSITQRHARSKQS